MVGVAAHVGVNIFSSRLALTAGLPIDWPIVHHTETDSRRTTMQSRMTNPFYALPDALKGIGSIFKAVDVIGVTNMFNRINAAVREPAGATWG